MILVLYQLNSIVILLHKGVDHFCLNLAVSLEIYQFLLETYQFLLEIYQILLEIYQFFLKFDHAILLKKIGNFWTFSPRNSAFLLESSPFLLEIRPF